MMLCVLGEIISSNKVGGPPPWGQRPLNFNVKLQMAAIYPAFAYPKPNHQ
jgi:hypothetical protein